MTAPYPPASFRPAARPEVPVSRFGERIRRAQAGARERGFDALLVSVGPDLAYLAGYHAMPLERLTMLVAPAAGEVTLVAPRLEAAPARLSPGVAGGAARLVTWEETEDATALVRSLLEVRAGTTGVSGSVAVSGSSGVSGSAAVSGSSGVSGSIGGAAVSGSAAVSWRLGVSDRLTAMHLLRLQAALPGASFASASVVLRDLRAIKDADEIALLRCAAEAADRVVWSIAHGRLIGRTEADVAHEVQERLVMEGHDSAEFSIVASGPNSASPHHDASDRVIGAGEPIVLDIGGLLGGYGSDITRTLWVTGGDPAHGPDREFLNLYAVLRAAQAGATHAVRPGVAAERVDMVAREIIAAAGHGAHFFHRTGHGIGLEGHEDPYLVAGNRELLAPGMAFSVEPGIYLEGRFGARIEDIVVCGEHGPIILNELDRDLLVVRG